jgi:hypothetical protein
MERYSKEPGSESETPSVCRQSLATGIQDYKIFLVYYYIEDKFCD